MLIMMSGDYRTRVQREPRRDMHRQPAWIAVDDESPRSECVILDVSPGGAKIQTDAEINVRDRFGLAPVPGVRKDRPCEVVWRLGKIYGLKFLP
jgi:hypothetical protein